MTFVLVVAVTFALAALRRCSVAQTVTLAFFLSSGLNSVTGTSTPDTQLAPINVETRLIEPWLQPCGTHVSAALKKAPRRHNVHRTMKRVRTQLRVAQNHFRKELKEVHDIYIKQVYNLLKKQYNMQWLPEKQFKWNQGETWCLEKGKKAELALPHLHDALQRFAITFYHLRNFHLFSDIDSALTMIKRNEIIDGMYNEILRMLCEVDSAIVNLGLELPDNHSSLFITQTMKWYKNGDMTVMLVQDWGVLRLYRTFLNDWIRAFRNATAVGLADVGPVCDPSKIKPLDFTNFDIRNLGRLKGKNKKKLAANKKKSKTKHNKPKRIRIPALGQNSSLSSPSQSSSLPVTQRKGHRANRLTNRHLMSVM